MTKISFDREKIKRYFEAKVGSGAETEPKAADEAYVQKVFTDEDTRDELKVFLSGQFNEILADGEAEKENLDHVLHKIHYDINTRRSEKKAGKLHIALRWALRLTGIILLPLVIVLGVMQLNENRNQKMAWVEIQAPAWSKVQFSLPDGSTGWLNSNSSIRYNGNFTNDRRITLNGEAFFDVYHNEKSPFTVTANEIAVKVLGTRFNITSYENEKTIEVVLEKGKVVFVNTINNATYTMKPNDLVRYDKAEKNFTTEVVQSNKYTSWIDGKLVFRNDPLDVVAKKLERWYNVEVELKVDLSENLRLRATFVDESLEEVLDLIRRSLPVDYKIIEGSAGPDGTFSKKKVIITHQ